MPSSSDFNLNPEIQVYKIPNSRVLQNFTQTQVVSLGNNTNYGSLVNNQIQNTQDIYNPKTNLFNPLFTTTHNESISQHKLPYYVDCSNVPNSNLHLVQQNVSNELSRVNSNTLQNTFTNNRFYDTNIFTTSTSTLKDDALPFLSQQFVEDFFSELENTNTRNISKQTSNPTSKTVYSNFGYNQYEQNNKESLQVNNNLNQNVLNNGLSQENIFQYPNRNSLLNLEQLCNKTFTNTYNNELNSYKPDIQAHQIKKSKQKSLTKSIPISVSNTQSTVNNSKFNKLKNLITSENNTQNQKNSKIDIVDESTDSETDYFFSNEDLKEYLPQKISYSKIFNNNENQEFLQKVKELGINKPVILNENQQKLVDIIGKKMFPKKFQPDLFNKNAPLQAIDFMKSQLYRYGIFLLDETRIPLSYIAMLIPDYVRIEENDSNDLVEYKIKEFINLKIQYID